ncbi:TauD/TfdA family dioxygenase [Actinomycetes bacterium KLBMP 9797]
MSKTPTADRLLAATRSVMLTFDGIPGDPVNVGDPARVSPAHAREIVRRYVRHGFAVCRLDADGATSTGILAFARSLCLGRPFLPPLYTKGGATAPQVSRISATHNTGTADADHPSFGTTAGQALHADGTLQDIGFIRSTLLLCAQPAAEGGDTILFNALGAFAELAETDLAAASALTVPGTLVRTANINGCTDSNAGPAFAVQDGKLIGRYSVTATDSWQAPDGVAAAHLHRGVGFLATASRPGSRYFTRLRLDGGDVILFDNTRLSHGRTPYRDAASRRRLMFRSLHLRHPRIRVFVSDVTTNGAAAAVQGG